MSSPVRFLVFKGLLGREGWWENVIMSIKFLTELSTKPDRGLSVLSLFRLSHTLGRQVINPFFSL